MNLRLHVPGPRWHGMMLRAASVLTLLALALMLWSIVEPTPMPVLIAMSVGEGFGVIAFGMYALVVIADVRRQYVRRRDAERASQRIPVVTDQPAPAMAAEAPAAESAVKESPP